MGNKFSSRDENFFHGKLLIMLCIYQYPFCIKAVRSPMKYYKNKHDFSVDVVNHNNLYDLWRPEQNEIDIIKKTIFDKQKEFEKCMICKGLLVKLFFDVWFAEDSYCLRNKPFLWCTNCRNLVHEGDVLKTIKFDKSFAIVNSSWKKDKSLEGSGRFISSFFSFKNILNKDFFICNVSAALDLKEKKIIINNETKRQLNKKVRVLSQTSNMHISKITPSPCFNMGKHPKYIKVELTQNCNLKCSFCPNKNLKVKKSISYDSFNRFWTDVAPDSIAQVNFTGLGETLLNKNFWPIHTKVKECDIYTTLVTNGSFLAKMADKIIDSGLNSIAVSLETMSNERYAHTRIGGSLEKILNNIDYFLDKLSLSHHTMSLNILTTFDLDRAADAIDVAKFCFSRGLTPPKIYPLYSQYTSNNSTVINGQLKKMKGILKKMRAEVSNIYGYDLSFLCREDQLLNNDIEAEGVEFDSCTESNSTFVLMADFTFDMCNESIFQINKKKFDVDKSVPELWCSEPFMLNRYSLYYKTPQNHCRNCNAYKLPILAKQ